MLDKMVGGLDFQAKALLLRAERQRAISSNIANADTPGYVARDFKFSEAMAAATSASPLQGASQTDKRHMQIPTPGSLGSSTVALGYSAQSQPNMDNNTVDLDRERANFVDNAVRYEASLRFINSQSKTMLSAIQGQ